MFQDHDIDRRIDDFDAQIRPILISQCQNDTLIPLRNCTCRNKECDDLKSMIRTFCDDSVLPCILAKNVINSLENECLCQNPSESCDIITKMAHKRCEERDYTDQYNEYRKDPRPETDFWSIFVMRFAWLASMIGLCVLLLLENMSLESIFFKSERIAEIEAEIQIRNEEMKRKQRNDIAHAMIDGSPGVGDDCRSVISEYVL